MRIVWNKKKRGWHDSVAGTVVVRADYLAWERYQRSSTGTSGHNPKTGVAAALVIGADSGSGIFIKSGGEIILAGLALYYLVIAGWKGMVFCLSTEEQRSLQELNQYYYLNVKFESDKASPKIQTNDKEKFESIISFFTGSPAGPSTKGKKINRKVEIIKAIAIAVGKPISKTSAPPVLIPVKGDTYYEQNVFPKIAAGGRSFNWWAFFFSSYWLAYKRLWKVWGVWIIPQAIVSATLYFDFKILSLCLAIGFSIAIGRAASKLYYERYTNFRAAGHPVYRGNVVLGITGVVAASLVVLVFIGGFIPSPASAPASTSATAAAINSAVTFEAPATDILPSVTIHIEGNSAWVISKMSCPSRGDREGAIQQDRVPVSIAGSVPSVFFFDSLLFV